MLGRQDGVALGQEDRTPGRPDVPPAGSEMNPGRARPESLAKRRHNNVEALGDCPRSTLGVVPPTCLRRAAAAPESL